MNATPPGPSLRLDRSLATHQRTTRPASIGSARRRRHLLAPLPAVRSFFFLLHHHIYWVFVAFLVGLPGSVCLSVGRVDFFLFFFSSNINRNRHSLCVISPPPSSLFGSLCARIILLLIVNSECASQPIHREKEKKKRNSKTESRQQTLI